MSNELTGYCVYTIVSRDRLDPVALEGGKFVGEEARTWKGGVQLKAEGEMEGQRLPLLLADAKDCSRLLYWGLLEDIQLLEGRTRYTVDRLRALRGRRSPQELVLRSTGEPIAYGFIRPYAICHTPTFLTLDDDGPELAPDEGPSEGSFVEGSTIQVTVNRYERDREARRRCIAHYGSECVACGFDFGARYGAHGQGFIEVHHLDPLSRSGEARSVDPIRDLRPLCSNCHSMIHRQRPPLTIEQLKALLGNAA